MTTPTPQVIYADDALALLETVVTPDRADYVYVPPVPSAESPCVYVHDGAPSCLVAYALAEHGVPVEKIALLDRATPLATPVAAYLLDKPEHAERLGVTLTSTAAEVFSAAQGTQDMGKPWGEALTAARRAYQRLTEGSNS